MSDEISRKIAEFFEPKPVVRKDCDVVGPSELGWWYFSDYWNVRIKPRLYTDPKIVVRLLKWLIEQHRFYDIPSDTKDFELGVAQAVLAEIERRSR